MMEGAFLKGMRDFAASYVVNKTHNYFSPHPRGKFRGVMGQGVLEYLVEGLKLIKIDKNKAKENFLIDYISNISKKNV